MFGSFEEKSSPDKNLINESIPEEDFDLPLGDRIVEHIAKNMDIVLISQQRNEPDLKYDERKGITNELLNNSPAQFLYRFGKYLKREHFQYFNSFSNNVEIKFYLQEAQKQLNESTKRLQMRNRRYGALRKMELSGSEYFKEEEMKKRDPLLYYELIDKNLTDDERSQRCAEAQSAPTSNFSDLLFEQIERNRVRDKQKEQERAEEDCFEEEEDEDEDEDEDEEELKDEENEEGSLDEGEKNLMREEFRTTICAQFISGKDKEFDYSKIDEADENDLLEWESQDLEERYFDDEEPQILPQEESKDNMES